MTAVEATEIEASIQVRDAFVIHALLQRLGSKNTYNEVKEAVSSSPREATIEWPVTRLVASGSFVILEARKSLRFLLGYVPHSCWVKKVTSPF